MTDENNSSELLTLTTDIVSAHVSNNTVAVNDLPTLIQEVFKTLSSVGSTPVVPERPQPAVPIKKSITPDYIICLEDGKQLKMLKRHLKTSYDMTPEDYRERWGLPADYPMVAPNYAAHRSKHLRRGLEPRRFLFMVRQRYGMAVEARENRHAIRSN